MTFVTQAFPWIFFKNDERYLGSTLDILGLPNVWRNKEQNNVIYLNIPQNIGSKLCSFYNILSQLRITQSNFWIAWQMTKIVQVWYSASVLEYCMFYFSKSAMIWRRRDIILVDIFKMDGPKLTWISQFLTC